MDYIYLLGGITTTFFSIAGYLFKSKLEQMEVEINHLRDTQKEIQENYLDRFEKLNRTINSSKLEILEKFHKLELTIIEKLNGNTSHS